MPGGVLCGPERLVDGDAKPLVLLWLSRAVVLMIGATAGGAGETDTWASKFVLESCGGRTNRSLGS